MKLKTAGKLNGKAEVIESKLMDSAEIAGLNYDEEYESAYMSTGTGNKYKTRDNPVEVPFTMTLKELDDLHKIRSIKKLNSYVGFKQPCYTARHQGVKENAHIAFYYDPDYRNKVYNLTLLLDGQKVDSFCAKGKPATFTTVWKKLLKKHGNLEFVIEHQDHAKKALGAKEYKRQEREYAKKQKKKSSDKQEKTSTGKLDDKQKKAPKKVEKETSGKEASVQSKTENQKEENGTSGTSSTGTIDVDKAEKQQAELKSLFQKIMDS